MEDPHSDIFDVVSLVTTSPSADIQRAAITRYYTEDAGFRNPFYLIEPGPLSREDVLGVYQWYRILSPRVELRVEGIIHDGDQQTLIVDMQQQFHIPLSPFKPVPARTVTRFRLRRKDDLYYISNQEDFLHPDEIFNLMIPPAVPLVRLFLSAAGIISTVFAKCAQVVGFWRTDKSTEELPPGQHAPRRSISVLQGGDLGGSYLKHDGGEENHVLHHAQKRGHAPQEDHPLEEVRVHTQRGDLNRKEHSNRKARQKKRAHHEDHTGSSHHVQPEGLHSRHHAE